MRLLLLLFFALATVSPALAAPAAPQAPKAQVRLDLRLTRSTGDAAPVVLGSPVLVTLDGNTGSIQVSGADLSYSVSISPALEKENRAALLWNVHLAGTSLPGATTVTLAGATRVALDKEETVAELSLRDPKSGVVSTYRLSGRTSAISAALESSVPAGGTPNSAPAAP